MNHYFQPVHWSKVAGVPITYVLNERDRPVLPAAQEEMSARLPPPATVVRVDSGHMLPVTAPATLADLLAALPLPRTLFGDAFGAYRAESVPRTAARTSTWGVGRVPWRQAAATTVEVS